MPDPLVYLQATGVAAIVSALIVLMVARQRLLVENHRWDAANCVALGLGLAVGGQLLAQRIAWPPASGLDRFLVIIIPALLGIEFIAAAQSIPARLTWILRLSLAAAVPRILLHDSVYLSGPTAWTIWHSLLILSLGSLLLASVWLLLVRLFERSADASIPLSLSVAILGAGLSVMMAGYIKGGATAFLLVSVLVATTFATRVTRNRQAPVILGIGVVSLFSVLFIGTFFGRLPLDRAFALGLAPLLCWATEWKRSSDRNGWFVGLIRLMLIAIPVIVVLILMKRDFDRNIAPLLGGVQINVSNLKIEKVTER
ncbi:MAG: hypothetical protein WCJ09_26505 [Planctomycetota bacterium]